MRTIKDLEKITRSLLMLVLLPLSVSVGAQEATEGDDDDLLLLIPSIVAGSATPAVTLPPVWTVVNEVCCSTSSATYSATIDNQTRSSRLASCTATEPSVPGVAESTAGTKSIRSELNSSTCGRLPFPTFQFPFEDSTLYIFQTVFNASSGSVDVNVLTADITPANQKALDETAQMKRLMASGKVKLLLTKSISTEESNTELKSSGETQGKFQSVQR